MKCFNSVLILTIILTSIFADTLSADPNATIRGGVKMCNTGYIRDMMSGKCLALQELIF